MKKMIEEVHSKVKYEPDRYVGNQAYIDFTYRSLFVGLTNVIENEKDTLPVDISETDSVWTPDKELQLDAYLVNGKIYDILKNKITPDMLVRLSDIDITELMKFIARHEANK